MFGRYPVEERWRVILTGIIFLALLVPLLTPRAPFKRLNAILFFAVFPFIAFFLLVGGYFGLPYVETPLWGGLMVTLVLSYVGIVVSLPLGILLALGRRSQMPAVKLLSRHLHRGRARRAAGYRAVHGKPSCCRCSCRRA